MISANAMPLFVENAETILAMVVTERSMESNAMRVHQHMKWPKNTPSQIRKMSNMEVYLYKHNPITSKDEDTGHCFLNTKKLPDSFDYECLGSITVHVKSIDETER